MDKKWWFLTKTKCSYIIVPGEEIPPNHFVKHTFHIIKAMCLPGYAWSCQNPETKSLWDGKFVMWSFVKYVPAQRATTNYPGGIIKTKSINVGKKVFVKMVIDNLLPAIKEKWTGWSDKKVRIHIDTAPAHKKSNKNTQINAKLEEMAAHGWAIDFILQPPNLLDTNIRILSSSAQYSHYNTRSPQRTWMG